MIEYLSTEDFKNRIFDFEKSQEWQFLGNKPTIVNFTASWCGPCQMFAPTLEKAAADHAGNLSIFKIDIDQNPEVPALFGIRSVPTTLFLKGQEQPILAAGVIPSESFEKGLEEIFGLKTP